MLLCSCSEPWHPYQRLKCGFLVVLMWGLYVNHQQNQKSSGQMFQNCRTDIFPETSRFCFWDIWAHIRTDTANAKFLVDDFQIYLFDSFRLFRRRVLKKSTEQVVQGYLGKTLPGKGRFAVTGLPLLMYFLLLKVGTMNHSTCQHASCIIQYKFIWLSFR